jgi:hypothetical protein
MFVTSIIHRRAPGTQHLGRAPVFCLCGPYLEDHEMTAFAFFRFPAIVWRALELLRFALVVVT